MTMEHSETVQFCYGGTEISGWCFRPSQFPIWQDGSGRCLYATLNTLQFFARFSGLKDNIEKTKLIWIG